MSKPITRRLGHCATELQRRGYQRAHKLLAICGARGEWFKPCETHEFVDVAPKRDPWVIPQPCLSEENIRTRRVKCPIYINQVTYSIVSVLRALQSANWKANIKHGRFVNGSISLSCLCTYCQWSLENKMKTTFHLPLNWNACWTRVSLPPSCFLATPPGSTAKRMYLKQSGKISKFFPLVAVIYP